MVTTVSTFNVEFARGLGADLVIDYKTERFEEKAGKVDMVFDLVGGETQDRSWQVIKPGGILISAPVDPDQEKAKANNVRALRFSARPNSNQLTEIAALIDKGEIKPVVAKVFPLDEIAEAHRFTEAGGFRGKVGIRI